MKGVLGWLPGVRRVLFEPEPGPEPFGLACALGVVGLDAAGSSAMRAATKPSSAGPSGMDGSTTSPSRRVPLLARDLVRAVGALARVGAAEVVVPCVDAPQQPAAGGDDLGLVLDDLAGELDLVQPGPAQSGDRRPARVDPAAAGVDLRLHPGAGRPSGNGQRSG